MAHEILLVGLMGLAILFKVRINQATEESDINNSSSYEPQLLWTNSTVEFIDGQWVGSFSCSFEGWPVPEISWHDQGGSRIIPEFGTTYTSTQVDDFTSTSTLTIGGFQESLANQYTCLAINGKGYGDGSVWPQTPPVVLVSADTGTVVSVGDIIIAECYGYADSSLVWKLPGHKENHNNVIYDANNNEINSTSTITFTATEMDNGVPYKCCIELQNPQKAISPACTSFSLTVNSKPTLVYYHGCSSTSESYPKCELTCGFMGYPIPEDVTWESCSIPDQCATIDNIPPPDINGTLVLSSITLDNVKNGLYKCKTGSENEAQYTFNINGNQIVPALVNHNFTISSDNNVVNVNFTCLVNANPKPEMEWLSENHLWSNGTETLISDGNTFNILETQISESVFQTTLQVFSYQNGGFEYSYFCQFQNENGISKSPPLMAYILDDFLELNASSPNNVFQNGDDVTVICYSGGYPAPVITMRVITEYDTEVTFVNDENSTTAMFTADWNNCRVKVECTSVNILQPLNPVNVSTEIFVDYESIITEVTNCTKDDFKDNGNCTLQCKVQISPLSLKKYFLWIYYTYIITNDTSYIIVDNIMVDNITPYKSIYSVLLTDYYAAYYQFYMQLFKPPYDIEELENMFQIDPDQFGVPLGEFCTNSSECLAINSKCEENICQCVGSYDILMTISSNTSACLTEAAPGMRCYNDMQCAKAALNYNCTESHLCECEGFLIPTDETNFTVTGCVDARMIGQLCTTDQQCELADEHMECTSGRCQCKSGYKYTTWDYRCESTNIAMTGGEIFGFILLALLVVGLICYGIKRYRDKKKLKKILEERKNIWPESEYDVPDKEYSTFDSSSLQFEETNGHIRMASIRSGSTVSGTSNNSNTRL